MSIWWVSVVLEEAADGGRGVMCWEGSQVGEMVWDGVLESTMVY